MCGLGLGGSLFVKAMLEDAKLLERYRSEGSEEAFAALVRRYLDLVYSVAYRQLGEYSHLASDVCQEVFLALARKGKTLGPDVVLVGWLYRSAVFAAKTACRRERRRQAREALAMTENDEPRGGDEIDWSGIRHALDEAIGALGETDRDVVCLRYFENRSFAEIGERVGMSENAARMRLNRALDKLNKLLRRRGIRCTAAVLGGAIGQQATLAAPGGLSVSIASAALSGAATGLGGSTFGTALGLMNTMKVATGVASVASVIAVGVAVLQSTRLDSAQAALSDKVASKQRVQTDLSALRAELAELDASIAEARGRMVEPASVHGFTTEDFEIELEQWSLRVVGMARYLDLHPQLRIPELDALTDKDWLDVAKRFELDNEADYRKALSEVRSQAKWKFIGKIRDALMAYLEESGGEWPSDPRQLAAYADSVVTDQILERYRVAQPGEWGGRPWKERAAVESAIIERGQVDPVWDTEFLATESFSGYGHARSGAVEQKVASAIERFEAENQRTPADSSEVIPLLDGAVELDTLDDVFEALTQKPRALSEADESQLQDD